MKGTKLMEFDGSIYRVVQDTEALMFRPLNRDEVLQFILWARQQEQGVKVKSTWHPITQDELLTSGRGEV